MSGEEKIALVEEQITDLERARKLGVKSYHQSILCPYCDKNNFEGQPLCCVKLGQAVAAILMRKDVQDKAEHVERILEKAESN